MIAHRLLIVLACVFLSKVVFAQEDSIFYRNDTAYVIKKPVVITKKVFIKENPKKNNIKQDGFSFAPYFLFSYTLDYIAVCKEKRSYFDQINNATSPQLNYTFGGQISYRRNRMLYSFDFAHTSFREQFNSSDTSQMNKHNVLTASIEIGYFILKQEQPISLLGAVGVGYLHTLSYKGLTFNERNHEEIISQTQQRTLDNSSLIISGKLSVLYRLTDKFSLNFGPTYFINFLSITQKHIPYDKWKNNLGIMAGIRFKFRRPVQ